MKIEHVLFQSVFFFKIMDPCVERSFLCCSHDPVFGSLKSDRVNGPLRRCQVNSSNPCMYPPDFPIWTMTCHESS